MLPIIGYVLLCILLLLLFLLLLPVHVRIRYDGTVCVWAGLGPISLCLFPMKKKTPKKEKSKTAEKKKAKSKKEKSKLTLEIIFDYIRLGAEALGHLRRKLVLRKLVFHLKIAGSDAASTAINYGRIAAGISAVYPVLDRNLRIKGSDIAVDADFEGTKTQVMADLTISACPFRLLIAGVILLIAFLKIRKKQTKQLIDEKGGSNHEQHQ